MSDTQDTREVLHKWGTQNQRLVSSLADTCRCEQDKSAKLAQELDTMIAECDRLKRVVTGLQISLLVAAALVLLAAWWLL